MSDTFSPVSARRRPPWPSAHPMEKTVPFVPENPRRGKRAGKRGSTGVQSTDDNSGGSTAQGGSSAAAAGAVVGARRRRRAAAARRPAERKPPRVRRRLRPGGLYRWVRRFRIPVAVLLGLCAAAAAMLAAESSQVQTTSAVRAAAPIAAGEVLTADVLEETAVDAEAVPAEHVGQMEDYLGETLATALPRGSLVHPSQLVGPGLLEGHESGTVAAPVRPADASMIGLLTPGQRVDVTAASDAPESADGSQRIAEAAPVLWIPQGESENWLGAGQESSQVVILAVDSTTAAAIAEASHHSRLHLSLVSAVTD